MIESTLVQRRLVIKYQEVGDTKPASFSTANLKLTSTNDSLYALAEAVTGLQVVTPAAVVRRDVSDIYDII